MTLDRSVSSTASRSIPASGTKNTAKRNSTSGRISRKPAALMENLVLVVSFMASAASVARKGPEDGSRRRIVLPHEKPPAPNVPGASLLLRRPGGKALGQLVDVV